MFWKKKFFASREGTVKRNDESGQAMIFFAVTAGIMMFTMGLAVEGGRLMVTQRQMQSAVDLAALVGAQKLPSAQGAVSAACQAAQDNGFDNCTSTGTSDTLGGTNKTVACAPPSVLQPYSWSNLNYGTDSSCSTPTGSTSAHYLEVQIQENLGTVPIFNIPVNLYAHAVARLGIPGVQDFAIVALDSTALSNAIHLHNTSGIITNGSITANSTASNSYNTAGSVNTICNGGAYASAVESDPGSIQTTNKGTIGYAPPSCTAVSGSMDSPDNWLSQAGQVADPYFASVEPTAPSPAGSTTWWLDRSNTSPSSWVWNDASAATVKVGGGGASVAELFPGKYPQGIKMTGGELILNPGIYQFGQSGGSSTTKIIDISGNGGSICVYGSPSCDRVLGTTTNPNGTTIPGYSGADCQNASFVTGGSSYVPANVWYYYCSPWGFYDTNTHNTSTMNEPAGLTTPEYFVDASGNNTTTPLNGVTIDVASGQISITGGGGTGPAGSSHTGYFLAAPNACAGATAVTAQVGNPNSGGTPGTATYPGGATGAGPADSSLDSTTPPASVNMYPDADLTKAGDCTSDTNLYAWPNEFGSGNPSQHLHFLFFDQLAQQSLDIEGSGLQLWFGIIHTFPSYTTSEVAPTPAQSCANCSVKISGSSGGANGPPMLIGQIVADSIDIGGSSVVQVFNRPGGQDTGPGTSLVE